MFKKIFIIEDTESDIEDLIDFLKLLPIEDDQMIIVKDINRAFDIIKTNCEAGEVYLAFIDVLWKRTERGITLAKSIRKTFSNIKVVAFTSIGEGGNIDKIKENFHGFLDKETSNPHPLGIQYKHLDPHYLDELENTNGFYIKDDISKIRETKKKGIMKNYFFKAVKEEKITGQFLIADFSRFSLKDDDQQLNRFKKLQDTILTIAESEKYKDSTIIFLPTGDGVAIGVLNENTHPFAVELSFDLLLGLRNANLESELRIGIHHGPAYFVIGEKGESQVIGPGINMAARVEGAGTPGAILVSDDYFRLFIDRSGNTFCQELTVSESKEYQVKTEKFYARYVSKGKIAQITT